MTVKHRLKADIKTDNDLPSELQEELKKMDKMRALEKALDYLLDDVHFYEVTQDRFKQDSELLFTVAIPDEMMPLVEKIETGCKSLGEVCNDDITEGDTTREEEKYVINAEAYEELPESEKSTYKKVIRGVSVKRHIVEWRNLYIKSLSEIPKEPRLLIKDYSKKPTVAYDDEGFRCLRTVYCAYPKDSYGTPKCISALLNSTLLHFYYLAYFYTSRPGKGSFRFRTQFLKRLPIKCVNSALQEPILKQVEKIISLKSELSNLKYRAVHFPNSYLEDSWVFDKLMNQIKAQSLSKPSYTISEKLLKTHYLKDLDGKEIFRINLAPNEYIDFSSEETASFVLETLKTRNGITKRELFELKVPSKEHLKTVMIRYRKDKERIVKTEEAIEEVEKQIDDLVYKLYDITYAERRIVQDFLRRF